MSSNMFFSCLFLHECLTTLARRHSHKCEKGKYKKNYGPTHYKSPGPIHKVSILKTTL